MTRQEAIKWLIKPARTSTDIGEIKAKEIEAYNVAIEALSAEGAVWNEYEAEFTDLPDIPRYYYEKVVGKMAHEINMLREQLESADAVQGEWILVKGSNGKDYHKCSKCLHTQEITGVKNYCAVCGARMKGGDDE